jgi:hypothetical protein
MLLAFYPVVSGAALLRARAERPEYFGGGAIIGRHYDALLLPDGTVWDLISNVDGVGNAPTAWQAIRPGPGGGTTWELEAGPLVPLDPQALPLPAPRQEFAQLAGAALRELGDAPGALEAHEHDMREVGDPSPFEAAGHELLDPARWELSDQIGSHDELNPAEWIEHTHGLDASLPGEAARIPDNNEYIDVEIPNAPPVPGGLTQGPPPIVSTRRDGE